MILDRLDGCERYFGLHAKFHRAFAWLRDTDLKNFPLGRHTIDGESLFVLMAEDPGRTHAGALLEAHQQYIDIQYVIDGADEMGWRSRAECANVRAPYDETKDIEFWNDTPSTWFDVPAGSFAVFFPHDAHAPLAGTGRPRKAVIKVAVDVPVVRSTLSPRW